MSSQIFCYFLASLFHTFLQSPFWQIQTEDYSRQKKKRMQKLIQKKRLPAKHLRPADGDVSGIRHDRKVNDEGGYRLGKDDARRVKR